MTENSAAHQDSFSSSFRCNRRRLLGALGTGAVGTGALGIGATLAPYPLDADEPETQESFPKEPAEALARLQAGNIRFVEGKTRHAHESANWRKHLIGGQKPFATILGCSDSRVPPELVFDQGFGDLFIVRVAGNVIATDVIGSLAYAARHLGTLLFVVMGHTGCGAVSAALDARLTKIKETEWIEALIRLIDPGLKEVDMKTPYATLLDAAIEANVRWSVSQLAALKGPREAIEEGRIMLVGAVYELETGRVRYLSK